MVMSGWVEEERYSDRVQQGRGKMGAKVASWRGQESEP